LRFKKTAREERHHQSSKSHFKHFSLDAACVNFTVRRPESTPA
jgi:hypothetical protein